MSEIAEAYRRRADAFEAIIAGTPPERWTSPSPCERWLARDIVAHVVEMHEIVLHPERERQPGPTAPAADGFDPAAAFGTARSDAERLLDDPRRDGVVRSVDGRSRRADRARSPG